MLLQCKFWQYVMKENKDSKEHKTEVPLYKICKLMVHC